MNGNRFWKRLFFLQNSNSSGCVDRERDFVKCSSSRFRPTKTNTKWSAVKIALMVMFMLYIAGVMMMNLQKELIKYEILNSITISGGTNWYVLCAVDVQKSAKNQKRSNSFRGPHSVRIRSYSSFFWFSFLLCLNGIKTEEASVRNGSSWCGWHTSGEQTKWKIRKRQQWWY